MDSLVGKLRFDADCLINAALNRNEMTADRSRVFLKNGMRNDLIRDLREAADALERYQWIPVSERLPDVGTSVLVYWHSGAQSVIHEWDDEAEYLYYAHSWQPPPPPPDTGAEE